MVNRTQEEIDDLMMRLGGLNNIDSMAMTNALYGFVRDKTSRKPNKNMDVKGHVFMTRPQLNLSTDNIKSVRTLAPLLTTEANSILRYVRMLLDPRLAYADTKNGIAVETTGIESNLIDNQNPFISIFSNTLESLSGWPDIVTPDYVSKEGVRREQWGYTDGFTNIYNAFDIDSSFRNTQEEPITLILHMWLEYVSAVKTGKAIPYPDMIVRREVDYQTRIYRLIMGEDGKKIKKISATGASAPLSVPMGKFFDMSKDSSLATQTNSINTRFKSFGAIYNDYILMTSFNNVVAAFNPNVYAYINNTGEHNLVRVPQELEKTLGPRLIPIINIADKTLEWWGHRDWFDVEDIINEG